MNYNQISYPLETRPGDGEVLEIRDGLFWVRMPIPIPGLDYINLYLIEDTNGWTLVDTGLNTKEIRDLWRHIFDTHLKGKPVTRVICTHFHPDHLGQAGWITHKWNTPLSMTFGEWSFGRMLYLEAADETPQAVIDHYSSVGFDDAMLKRVRDRGFSHFKNAVSPVPLGFTRLEDGDRLRIGKREWQVIVGRGHSPEHACLYAADEKILISGDQVLPRITPHIGIYPSEPFANPLKKFIDSIEIFEKLPEDTLVLPAHNDVFQGLHNQLDYYKSHHEDRLNRLLMACASPQSAHDLLPVLFDRELNENDKGMGIAEGLAHCHYLIGEGLLERLMGDDGVWKFRATNERRRAVA